MSSSPANKISSTATTSPPMASYDMQYTPLLPSQLVMGSPFQPGTPAMAQYGFAPPPGPQDYSPGGPPPAFIPHHYYGGAGGGGAELEPINRSRTVYLGNVPPETTAEELLNHVRSGIVESVKIVPEKTCAFVSFLDHASAAHFHSDAILKKLSIKGNDIKVGWGKSGPVSPTVSVAVAQDGASRNVYLGNLPDGITEEEIRNDMEKFGPIDTIKLVHDKHIGFVHFLTIATAVNVVQQLPYEPQWTNRKVFYGKDRCAYISKTQQQNAAQYLGISPGNEHVLANADREMLSNALAQQSAAAVAVAAAAGGAGNVGNRTVYLGNVHPETTIEEICNVVRGGLLHNIRYIAEKHICFVTFIDPTAAAQFFALANLQGLAIHNRRLKVGWGKHSGPLPNAIALAVTAGASRNVYIGNIDDNWPESKLRKDFSEFGDIEQINFLPEKSCAFVNFTNITNAIKAIEGIKQKDDYKQFKINFGKDRCGNPPRHVHYQHSVQSPSVTSPSEDENNNNINGGYGFATTPGSHVLAQYLAQAQHEQYMYAAAVAAARYSPPFSDSLSAGDSTPVDNDSKLTTDEEGPDSVEPVETVSSEESKDANDDSKDSKDAKDVDKDSGDHRDEKDEGLEGNGDVHVNGIKGLAIE